MKKKEQMTEQVKSTNKDKMGNSSTKFLSTSDGHSIKLTPKGIEVICSGGTVTLEILKSGRINIYAEDTIQIMTDADVTFKAKTILRASCKEAAYFVSQQGGSLMLTEEGNMIFQGTEVHMN